ncbi:hypothetical protein DID78_01425 [Candidatus Marinamargulisbacteria bacterium SCGC AG-343-D04]|nr:hypothetical protein DID78_01425 [Candidatus Marinamargulisbacteria bacterium SCGC AG-343-D04]
MFCANYNDGYTNTSGFHATSGSRAKKRESPAPSRCHSPSPDSSETSAPPRLTPSNELRHRHSPVSENPKTENPDEKEEYHTSRAVNLAVLLRLITSQTQPDTLKNEI